MKCRRAGDPGDWIIVHLRFPDQSAVCRVDGVDVRGPITDERGVPWSGICSNAADADGRAHGSGCSKKPVDAAGGGTERIDVAALAADENTAADDRGLGVGADVTGKTKSPFELQPRHVRRGEPGHRAILISRIGRIHAPAVPERSSQRVGEVVGGGGAHGLPRGSGVERPPEGLPGDEFGDGTVLYRRTAARHGDHDAGFHGGENPLRRHGPQRLAIWGALDASVMAGGAKVFVERRPVLRGKPSSGREKQRYAGGEAKDQLPHSVPPLTTRRTDRLFVLVFRVGASVH